MRERGRQREREIKREGERVRQRDREMVESRVLKVLWFVDRTFLADKES